MGNFYKLEYAIREMIKIFSLIAPNFQVCFLFPKNLLSNIEKLIIYSNSRYYVTNKKMIFVKYFLNKINDGSYCTLNPQERL